ncbi:aminoglycoside 3'-phosphotransferase [[Mycobacterium] nativiensis]|uniref:Aminoglycoside 3'-phosphotransferase n=1 Tax=[Mycobacterium] nativiensis TaxID=2855503 RepID=A0ABU5XXX7_9MYCO|nr:aminoglycoside 3'-phosphotransferase [Mycolicibacter sp. MYC340]MEB3032822.1 aminoglycoside 3'-phosphotransferase [Mycolicibacter sp. MYC340]
MIAGPPEGPLVLPDAVRQLAGDDDARPVWHNEAGGTTFEVDGAGGHRFIKWSPTGSGIDLSAEVQRLRWAARYTPVPRLLDSGHHSDGQWMLTQALPGSNAVVPRWIADPQAAVAGLGRGLRELHDALPVAACPFDWGAEKRVEDAKRRSGQLHPGQWPAEFADLTVEQALRRVADPPPLDRLVVCHGDACAPNTLLNDDGSLAGHVDLGSLGIADRWADLAVVTWSTEWNYGADWTDALLDAYGVQRDQARIDYYRLLWNLGP